jgi:hypothetical protein
MAFRSLRVIDEDRFAPGAGFPMHRHRDMEIVTWVLDGAIRHEDSMGHAETLRPGEVQRMTAGRGIMHSRFDSSPGDSLHLLQVWIVPDRRGHEPGYEQKDFAAALAGGGRVMIASPDGRSGSATIHQDATIEAARLTARRSLVRPLLPGHVASGGPGRGDAERRAAGGGRRRRRER